MNAFWIKWTHWEFWPTWLVYLPVLLCYPFWALRVRSPFFYSLINPGLTMGGLYGTAKSEALSHLDKDLHPGFTHYDAGTSADTILDDMNRLHWSLPVVVKPEYGERGQGVDLVKTPDDLRYSVSTQRSAFMIQPYIDLPFEAGVFYIRHPKSASGKVVSIVVKGFLSIEGDGIHSVETLAKKEMRALMIWERLKKNLDLDLDYIPAKGERHVLEPIGNHSRGTAFNDGNHLITDALNDWTERAARQIPGFYYGRFDVRAPDEASFKRGFGLQVMEVNGANAEPAHIYQEGASLLKGWATLLQFWSQAASIAAHNRKQHKPASAPSAHRAYKRWRTIKTDKWDRRPSSGGKV